MKKFNSRKFVMLNICIGLSSALPIAFQVLKIDSSITMMSLGMIGGLASIYFGANIIDKKFGGE